MSTKWTGIRAQLVLLVLAVAVPLAASDAWRVWKHNVESRRALDQHIMHTTSMVAGQIDDRLHIASAMLFGLSEGIEFLPTSRMQNDTALSSVRLRSGMRDLHVFAVDTFAHAVGSSDGTEVPAYVLEASRRAIRAATSRSHTTVEQQFPLLAENGVVSLRVINAITDAHDHVRGALIATLQIDSIANLVRLPDEASQAFVTIVDTTGRIIARSKDARNTVGRVVPTAQPSGVLRDSIGVSTYLGHDGVRYILGYSHLKSAPWIVSMSVVETDALAPLRRETLRDLGTRALVIVLALIVALVIGGRIAKPLDELTNDARALTLGSAGHRSRIQSKDEIGGLAGAFNQMAETVERRNASLADSERRYRLLFDSNPLPMWAWDADTLRILAVNEAALEKYGYDRDEFLTRRILDLLDPIERERFTRSRLPFSEARQNAGMWMHRTSDGRQIEMEVVTTSSRRLGRASWLSVGIDITARRAAERALALSEEQLRQSQKMEAVGAFAGGISHDFNNLLTGILGYCDLALSELTPRSEAHNDVNEIRTLAFRGADLTRQILAVSRKQVMQPTVLDPNAVVLGLDRLLRRLIGEHIVLETRLGEHIGCIWADAGQLEQVLLNLCANARDAMPAGGTLSVETGNVLPSVVLARGLSVETPWVTIRVSDTGSGMTEQLRRRIFEPFFTTKPRGKGTGLGLALAYAMVEQSGGEIHVESELDIGTTFELFFPMRDATVAPPNAEPPVHEVLTGDETILFTEDEDGVRAVATAALQRRGYRVLSATDGESALEIARTFPHRIDLLLTDVVMPRMNGRELAEAFERQRPEARVLFASGYTDDASLLHGIRTDELSFLQKPFTTTELLRRVRSVLDQPQRVS